MACLETFRGCTVKGSLQTDKGRMFIFDCGWGFEFNSNGAYWVVDKREVEGRLAAIAANLKKTGVQLQEVLRLAGESA